MAETQSHSLNGFLHGCRRHSTAGGRRQRGRQGYCFEVALSTHRVGLKVPHGGLKDLWKSFRAHRVGLKYFRKFVTAGRGRAACGIYFAVSTLPNVLTAFRGIEPWADLEPFQELKLPTAFTNSQGTEPCNLQALSRNLKKPFAEEPAARPSFKT